MSVRAKTQGASPKVKDLDALAATLERLRGEGKRVVHCHGVFDLLHIGHIRYFTEAKAMGDVLAVTITPDQHVNRGPHRPVFNQDLRAEATASLDAVDFVAVNRWPLAVDTIKMLKPDLYVKGPDYKDMSQDRTGGIELEQKAVEEVGGRLAFTDDITFSSSALINQNFSVHSKEVEDYLADFAKRTSQADIFRYIDGCRDLRVLVVGEAIIDEYHYCEAIGKSSKEPMLAVKYISTEKFAGGTMAVANHVSNFSNNVELLTFLGEMNPQEEFIRENIDPNVDPTFIRRTQSPTILKTRYIEKYFFTKMFEVYTVNDHTLDPRDDKRLCTALKRQIPHADVVLVVDYGHGMLSDQAIEILCKESPFLAVNAQSNAGNLGYHAISRYPRADLVCIAENEIRLESRDRRGKLEPMVESVSKQLSCPNVMVTRGDQGCLGYNAEAGFASIPALAGKVVDRMGAGDAFLSVAALCVAQKAPIEIAGFVGNAAGAHAVATVGHRKSVERGAFSKHIETLLKWS